MMNTELDHGIRCDSHTGEVFRVRCRDCDAETAASASLPLRERSIGFLPGSACEMHPDYPLPCARCQRDEAGESS